MSSSCVPIRLRADVTLGPILPECAERMFQWASDPEVSSNLGLQNAASMERTHQWIENAATDKSIHALAILLDGVHVGNVVLDLIDRRLSKARFSLYIGEPAARAKRVGLTGTYLALRVAFQELDLFKVWLTVHAQNTRAIRTYLNAGFRKEGLLRGEFLLGGERLDAWYMGILAGEFAALAATLSHSDL